MKAKTRDDREARNEDIKRRFLEGQTLEQAGAAHGLTRERARQILMRYGLNKNNGGGFMLSRIRVAKKKAEIEKKQVDRLGMTLKEMRDLRSEGLRCPRAAYRQQVSNAKRRGCEWTITFADWWKMWQEDGRYGERGRLKVVMTRIDFSIGFVPGNVKICTQSESSFGWMRAAHDQGKFSSAQDGEQ